ncbi:Tetratricopeptide repeat protein like [Quillaja saponaria]|uniref:Protein unc-45 homolog B n=1 Tax=Quillaja saponaria TaxID=32244 RepID=A0AAD7PTH5_QUISA|nr:Tetratricopeptide repeat protein like [Quillaja saponaria]
MKSLKQNKTLTSTPNLTPDNPIHVTYDPEDQICTNPSCFFCTMNDPDASLRRARIFNCFKEIPLKDTQEHVLVLSGLWHIAMTHPNDLEFPSLGIFNCMVTLLHKAISDKKWLLRNQNIYIPYYAAHVIGSYTMNKEEFAEMAVQSGVIPPLIELLGGKISWVEQRVAVRALGHLASYKSTFEAVTEYEEEVVKLTMKLASNCLEVVYVNFVGVKDATKRLKYHSDLFTRGIVDLELENRKAEEWASQLQCWSLYLLNCFAWKGRSLNLICKQDFLEDLCDMWGGLVNHTSPAGVGLIRILCYSKIGRKRIAQSEKVLSSLCNLSRSSDDWQYMGIDCLLLLLKDPDTRCKVIEIAALFLTDLVELRSLAGRSNLGEAITKVLLLLDYRQSKQKIREVWDKVERRNKERIISEEKVEERRVFVNLIKQQADHMFWLGELEEAIAKYSEALDLCPLRFRKERLVLYSNRSQCHLLLKDPDSAISDSTRALCLSNPANSHSKSLWRRSQAYDMKGMAKESLMDCLMFINGSVKSSTDDHTKRVKIPYQASRMISKQMDATWLFANARSKVHNHEDRGVMSGLSTIIEEPLVDKELSRRKLERERRRLKKACVTRSVSVN